MRNAGVGATAGAGVGATAGAGVGATAGAGAELLGVLLVSALALTACHRADGQQAAVVSEQEVPVRVVDLTSESHAPVIEASGVLAVREEIPLSFKIGGVVARVQVNEGQRVRAGQVLAALEQAEIEAAVAKAKSALDKAERDLNRARNLYRDSVATLEQVQNAETGFAVARSDHESARFNQRYASIVAPASGVVLRRTLEPGQLVAPGQPALTLGNDASGVVVRVGLSDRDAVRVRVGDAAEVRFAAYPGQVFAGRVREVGVAAQPQTGTYAIEIALQQPPRALSGLIGQARIRPASQLSATLIPVDAVMEADGQQAVVYALGEDQRVRRVAVHLGELNGDRVSVVSGLTGVTRIVTSGSAYLVDGSKVRVVQ